MNPRNTASFTWIETTVALAVGIVFIAVLLPSCSPVSKPLSPSQMTQTLSNMKQLHFATEQMVIDGVMKGVSNMNWPGNTGGTFSNWAALLVPGYLSTNDFAKFLSAPDMVLPPDQLPLSNTAAVLVYAVAEDSEGTAVFLSTANFTNTPTGGSPLKPNARPYGDKGFVVFRKDGTGSIFLPEQTGEAQTNIIGSFAPLCR